MTTERLRPKWRNQFQGFPHLPKSKLWRTNERSTEEQDIYQKISKRESLTKKEKQILDNLNPFYEEVIPQIKAFNYSTLSETELFEFAGYVLYAFNWTSLLINDLTIFQTFRLVVNESVTKKNSSLTNSEFLKYPPLQVNQNLKRLNRANTFESTVFYSSENADTLIKEIKPPFNKLLTIGIWENKNSDFKLRSHAISHSSEAEKVNEGVRLSTNAVEKEEYLQDEYFGRYYKRYLNLFSHEFTKIVSHNNEYIISALFSENILNSLDSKGKNMIDCIIYPSLGNNYKTNNLAVTPYAFEKHFTLIDAVEFELLEYDFDKEIPSNSYGIQVLNGKTKNFRKAKSIMNQTIIW